MNNQSVTETSRIIKVLPTIKFLIDNKAKIIIISHVGRPKGKISPNLSLKPIAKKLANLLDQKVIFFNDTATTEIYTLSLHDALPISWIKSCIQNGKKSKKIMVLN